MTRHSLRFMLVFMGLMLAINPTILTAQTSADISAGIKLNGVLSSTTSLSPKAGDTVVIEVFSTTYTSSQGVEVILEVSDPAGIASAKGASPEFPVIIDSKAGNTFTLSSVIFGAPLTHSGDPKLVATMTLVLADPFSPITIKLKSVDFGGNPLDPGISFELTKPSNNLISNISVTPTNNSARIGWTTLFPGTSSVVTYNSVGSTTSTPVSITLTAESTAHTASLTGLTAATAYEYQIASTSTSGEISPDTKGTFKTRTAPDTRPVVISNVNFSSSGNFLSSSNRVFFTWVTSRLADTRIKVEKITTTTNLTDFSTTSDTSIVFETQTDAQGTEHHRSTGNILNLSSGFLSSVSYRATITSRGVGLDDLITQGLMTEANVTATHIQSFNLDAPQSLSILTQTATAGTNQAIINTKLNSAGHVRVFYGIQSFEGFFLQSYTNSVASAQASKNHTLTLGNLQPGQSYAVLINADFDPLSEQPTTGFGFDFGSSIRSKELIFRTQKQLQPPTITLGPQVVPRSQQAAVIFGTDIPTTAQVFVGTVGTGGTLGTSDEIAHTDLTSNGAKNLSKRHVHLISGLTRGTQYGYRIEVSNAAGQATTFDPFNTSTKPGVLTKQVVGAGGGFGTSTVDDTQLPLITRGPTVINKTESTLTIEWDTDELANSTINYGTSADSLNSFALDGEPVTTHRITLTGLTPATTYAYQIGSTDISNNGPVQGNVVLATTLTQPDITAPTYSGVPNASYIADTRADIEWTTNELSNGEINFGTSATTLDQFATINEFALKQGVTLANLTAGATYFYQISSSDLNGNGPAKSAVLSFTTLATADTQAPTIADVAVSPTDSAAVVIWTTDEQANSVVQFGLSADSLNTSISDINPVAAHKLVLANLTPNTTYTYRVQSSDPAKNGPTSSTPATFTTAVAGSVQGPAAPAGLTARAGNGSVQLTWSAPDAAAIGLLLERAAGDGSFTALATLDPTTIYIDNSAINNTAYRYRLTAQGLFQRNGEPSAATEAVTPATNAGPSVPSLSGIQGTPTTPSIIVNNSTPLNEGDTLTYTFQLSTLEDYSNVVVASTVASGNAGTTTYTVGTTLTDRTKYFYRVKANDGFSDSPFLSGSFTVNASAPAYPGDFNGDLTVGFPDFLAFVGTFNKKLGDTGYNGDADFNGDGTVGFPDFLAFVAVFNKVYAAGKPVAAVQFDTDTQAQFSLNGHFVQNNTDRELAVDVQLKDVTDLQGYGIQVNYDPTVLEFINATDEGDTFLKSDDRSADLFGVLNHNKETGALYIASAVTQGNPVSGAGTLGTLTFRLLDPNRQDTDIHIAQGILFNPTLDGFMAINLGDRFSLIPTEFALEHNFPNPFNPETTLRYALPNAGQVTLSIYNVLGQEVVQLVNAEQMPGFYNISWNGKDALGHTVASGVYLYRIQAGDFNQTHKMLLLK